MDKRVSSALTGVAVSMAVGTAAYVMANRSMKPQRRAIKKNAGKAIRAVGGILDTVVSLVR